MKENEEGQQKKRAGGGRWRKKKVKKSAREGQGQVAERGRKAQEERNRQKKMLK